MSASRPEYIYNYSGCLRLILGPIGLGLTGLGLLLLLSLPWSQNLVAAGVAGGFGGVVLWMWLAMLPTIILGAEGVRWRWFAFITHEVRYDEITDLQQDFAGGRLVIQTTTGRWFVEHQLERFDQFHANLLQRLPNLAAQRPTLPLTVPYTRFVRGFFLVLILVGGVMVVGTLLTETTATLLAGAWEGVVVGLFVGGVGAAYYFWLSPDQYLLEAEGITLVYPGRREFYAWRDLQNIAYLGKPTEGDANPYTTLFLQFPGKTLRLERRFTDYSINLLAGVISAQLRKLGLSE